MQTLIDHRVVHDIPLLEFYNPGTPHRLPLVIILHGFTGKKEDNLVQGYALARKGYYAVSMDLHLHGELRDPVLGPSAVSARFLEIMEQSLANLHTLVALYTESDKVDPQRIGLLGVSLGGAVIYSYLPQRAPAVKAAVTMVAGPAPLAAITFAHIQQVHPEFGVTDELVSTLATVSGGSPFLEYVIDFPLLVQHGQLDPLIPISGVRDFPFIEGGNVPVL